MAPAARGSLRRRAGPWRGLAQLGVLLLAMAPARVHGQMARLVGGALTWTVNPAFLGGAGNRTVTFNLRTSWAVASAAAPQPSCAPLKKGEKVACPISAASLTGCNPALGDAGCGAAERFGVLCIAQLVWDGTEFQYQPLYRDGASQCVSEANAHVAAKWVGGRGSPGVSAPRLRSALGAGEKAEIGIANEFVVQQIYDEVPSEDEEASSVARKPGPSVVVTGTLSHTVVVDQNADSVVAWLAPRRGFANFDRKTGLLLEGCTTQSTGACMFNECSLQRTRAGAAGATYYRGAGMREVKLGAYLEPDPFWLGWKDERCTSGGDLQTCIRNGSPALETTVPLCSPRVAPVPKRSCSAGVNNYYSPVASVPDLVEVAVTPIARLAKEQSPWKYKGYNPVPGRVDAVREYRAPHQGFRVQSYDYDGHQMTQYTPQLFSELSGSRKKMGWGDYMLAFGQDPFDECPDANDKCCTQADLRFSMRVDCVRTDALQCQSSADCRNSKSPVRLDYWPAVVSDNGGDGVDSVTVPLIPAHIPSHPLLIPGSSPLIPGSSPLIPCSSPIIPCSSPAHPRSSAAHPHSSPAHPHSSPLLPRSSPLIPGSSPLLPCSSPAPPHSSRRRAAGGVQGQLRGDLPHLSNEK